MTEIESVTKSQGPMKSDGSFELTDKMLSSISQIRENDSKQRIDEYDSYMSDPERSTFTAVRRTGKALRNGAIVGLVLGGIAAGITAILPVAFGYFAAATMVLSSMAVFSVGFAVTNSSFRGGYILGYGTKKELDEVRAGKPLKETELLRDMGINDLPFQSDIEAERKFATKDAKEWGKVIKDEEAIALDYISR